jgi:hypothetical protein
VAASNGSSALWLSCHVHYQCRHSGACCRSGWPLPVEHRVVADIDRAVSDGRLRTVDGSPVWLLETRDAPEDMAGTLRQTDGGCVFHLPAAGESGRGGTSRHCAAHAALGHAALPASCQHFPRVCLIDDRGIRVALSHYCPTAASLLVNHAGPVAIVSGPPPVPGLPDPEGLDVRGGLPPRLASRVLMDWPGLTAWEAHVVEVLAGPTATAGTADAALARLSGDAERLAAWRPGVAGSLADAVARLADAPAPRDGESLARSVMDARAQADFAAALDACRPPWTWPEAPGDLEVLDTQWVAAGWQVHAAVVRRYLAAKAFASWVTYHADATRALVAWLRLVSAVLRIECGRACAASKRSLDAVLLKDAIRQSDLLLVHYADSARLAAVVTAD